jgi:tryptophan synthase alpha chain
MQPRERIRAALARDPKKRERPKLVAYITAGYPEPREFLKVLRSVSSACDAVEIGVPFSDPMADGVTIQRSSRRALEQGVTLAWILESLAGAGRRTGPPVVLMSYLNPLLAYGYARLARDARAAGVHGFIVPDLPLEECAELGAALDPAGLALVQMVTPVTPPARLAAIALASQGFLYAVTRTGTTGGGVAAGQGLFAWLDRVRALSPVPVCAGFGVRERAQVAALAGHVDGVVVGSALVEALERGADAAAFLGSLRAA